MMSKKMRLLYTLVVSVYTVITLFAPVATIAMSKDQQKIFAKGIYYYDFDACSAVESVGKDTSEYRVSLKTIAQKYNLQSAIIQEIGGDVIADYNANEPPSSPASTMKVVIAATALKEKINLDKTVRITEDVLYADRGDDTWLADKDSTTLKNAMRGMLEKSSNIGANLLMKELGGTDGFTQKAQAAGYKDTSVSTFYNSTATATNKSTIYDQAKAMNDIFAKKDSDYVVAQEALGVVTKKDNQYDVDGYKNKWGGTDKVASNVGAFDINGKKYIIGSYYTGGSYTSDAASKAMRDGTKEIIELIEKSGVNADATEGASGPVPDASITYKAVGNIPEEGKTVGASIYGGTYRGGKFIPTNKDQDPTGKNGASDDPGIGNRSNKLAGTASYAELSTGGGRFNALGSLPDGTKLEITYKGKTVIAEKGDVGGGGSNVGGEVRAIDLWWELAEVMGFKSGLDTVKVRGVADDTPLTPMDGSAKPAAGESDATAGCECGEGGEAGENAVQVTGSDNQAKIWNYLVGELNFSAKQAAGIMGNIWQESKYDPKALNPDSGAYGIIQWYAGRKTALENFAREKGKDVSNIEVQLQFLKKELEGSYKAPVADPIRATSSVEAAARIWLEKFEIPCLPGSAQCAHEMTIRMPQANANLRKYGGSETATANNGADTPPAVDCDDSSRNNPEGDGNTVGRFAWPISKSEGIIFSCYGYARGRLHSGIDIAAPVGTKVVAADGGTVIAASNIDPGGFGNTVIIKHSNSRWTLYAHLSNITVQNGDKVSQGQEIAKSGGAAGAPGSGSSQGPHLHFNIQKSGGAGQGAIDPLKSLPKDGRAVNTGGGDCPGTPTFR